MAIVGIALGAAGGVGVGEDAARGVVGVFVPCAVGGDFYRGLSARGVLGLGHAALGVGLLYNAAQGVVFQGGEAAVGPVHAQDPARSVAGVGGNGPAGLAGNQAAHRVVGVEGDRAVRAGDGRGGIAGIRIGVRHNGAGGALLGHQAAQAVVGHGFGAAVRIEDPGIVVGSVVFVAGHAALFIRDAYKVAGGIVGVDHAAAAGVGGGEQPARGVVGVAGGLTGEVGLGQQLAGVAPLAGFGGGIRV